MADKLRWGIISTAGIGKNAVIPGIHAARNGEVAAVASRDIAKGRAFAEANGIPKAYGSYEELLADPTIDAIYNPLPNDLHLEWSIKAAEAGKPVLCEKPLTMNAGEARQMVEYFRAKGVLLEEAVMYRFHPQTIRVKQLVDDGAIGDVHMMNSMFNVNIPDPNNIRYKKANGGGCILDLGFYPLNILRLIAGEPDKWSAFGKFNDDGVDVRAVGALGFPNGISGTFGCDFQGHFTQSYDIRGTRGRIYTTTSFSIAKDKATTIYFWHDEHYEEITIPPANHYTLMVEDFADAILEGRAPRLAPDESIRSMETIDKCIALADANRLV